MSAILAPPEITSRWCGLSRATAENRKAALILGRAKEGGIPEHVEKAADRLAGAAERVPVENVAEAGNQLASIARSIRTIGGDLADRLLKKVTELQAEAHDLTTGLANLRGSVRRAATHVLSHDLAVARSGRPGGFGTPEWLARVSVAIDPRTTKVTTGLVFDSAGHHIKTVESGRDELSRSAQAALAGSRQFPKPPAWRAGDELAVADHVETKIAMWLLRAGIPRGRCHVTVVINKDKPCGRPYGCQIAVRAILPREASVTVMSSITGLSWTLKGVAPS